MNKEEFVLELRKLGINPDKNQLDKLELYFSTLIEWNKVMNLTRIISKEDVYLKHFYDCLTVVKAINMDKEYKICDVGSGAGFPGIVLKIFFPKTKIVLVDSLNKRIKFLNEVIKILDLKEITAIHSRMEDYSKNNKECFDIITSRAVAKIPTLIDISIKSLKKYGYYVLYKANCEEEIKESKEILDKANCRIENVVSFLLPKEESKRTLIVIKKNK